jgi:hypothetical protein
MCRSCQTSRFGSLRCRWSERKKEWNMARMIKMKKMEPKKVEPGWLVRLESKQ